MPNLGVLSSQPVHDVVVPLVHEAGFDQAANPLVELVLPGRILPEEEGQIRLVDLLLHEIDLVAVSHLAVKEFHKGIRFDVRVVAVQHHFDAAFLPVVLGLHHGAQVQLGAQGEQRGVRGGGQRLGDELAVVQHAYPAGESSGSREMAARTRLHGGVIEWCKK